MTSAFPNPFAQQQAAQAPQQPAPAPAMAPPAPVAPAPQASQPFNPPSAPAAPGGDPFGAPAPPAPRAPRIMDLFDGRTGFGRLLLLAPYKQETITRQKTVNGAPVTQVSERITMDMAILDGGTIHYGGKPEKAPFTPHTQTAEPPVLFEAVWNENVAIISACRDALRERRIGGAQWMVLGRLGVGEARNGNNAPWLLTEPTEADQQMARAFLVSPAAVPMLSRQRGA